MPIDRYRELIDDWERFEKAAARPEPVTLRARSGRIEPEALRARLERRGFRLERMDAPPDFFRVLDGPHRASNTLEHWLGLFYIQQASTGVAAPALGPRPGERVLDLCAAPGGKTTHAADLMDGAGCVVAADVKEKRLRGLVGNLYRMGHANVATVAADGRAFPVGALFDRVLVDAPCSAEGNLRGRGGEPATQPPSFLRYVTELQEKLLRSAVALARPGGVILYSTCTFNPDENEAVVDRVLADGSVRLEEIRGGAPHAPGAAAYGETRHDAALSRAWRVYPHHLDSGGLFMARLRREGGEAGGGDGAEPAHTQKGRGVSSARGADAGWSPVPPAFPDDPTGAREGERRIEEALLRLHEEFAIPLDRLRALGWMVRGDSLWVHGCREWPVEAWTPRGDWRFLTLGMRALKDDRRFGLRPTNDFLRWIGPHIGRRVLRLDAAECLRLLEEGTMPPPEGLRGAVALSLEGWVVGRAVATRHGLRHEIPKGRAARLRQVLEVRRAGEVRGR